MIKLKTSLTEQDYYELDPFDELKNKKEFVTNYKGTRIKGIVYRKDCNFDDFIDISGKIHKKIGIGYIYKIKLNKKEFNNTRKILEYDKISIDDKICYIADTEILPNKNNSIKSITIKFVVYDLEMKEIL